MGYNNVNVNVSGPKKDYTSTYKTYILRGNMSFANQVTEPNVKYVVKYDFDLDGGTVTIPEGCLLEFDGGSVSNGTIEFDNTILIYNQQEEDVLKNITMVGDYEVSAGGKGDKKDNINGMGKIYLKKNKGFAEQLTQDNTIYVIQYDFTLTSDVTIPADCVLEFDGGSIGGAYTLTGSNTILNGENIKIKQDVAIAGTWANDTIYTKWFEFVSTDDGTTDNVLQFKQLQNMINGTKGCKVEFEPGYYQTSIIDYDEGVIEIDGVTYKKYAMNDYQRDERVVLCIRDIPYVDINLNGSTIQGISILCPNWSVLEIVNVDNSYTHDGTLIGMAINNFAYPTYAWFRKVDNEYKWIPTNDYEFASLYYQCGGFATVYNMNTKYSNGDGVIVGSGSWYYLDGRETPLSKFPAKGYIVRDSEVSYCGRNGVTLHSSDTGQLKNLHIHNVGSDAASGVIGSDGIMGRNPQSGIDIEFEDQQYRVPVMNWDSLYIHDCAKKTFGFAAPQYSKMKSFSCTNSTFIGLGLPNNMNAEGTMEYSNCYFEHIGREGTLLGSNIKYINSTFVSKANAMGIGNNLSFEGCTIRDENEENIGGFFNRLVYNSIPSKFNNCVLTIKHAYGKITGLFTNCTLNVYAKGQFFCLGSEFYNCTFNKDPEYEGDYSFSIVDSGNYDAVKMENRHYKFNKCLFNTNLTGVGTSASEHFTNTIYPILMEGCTIQGTLDIFHGRYCPNITIRQCIINKIGINGYQQTGENVKTAIIDGCEIYDFNVDFSNAKQIEVYNSKINIVERGNYKLQNVTFTNCIVTNNVARATYYSDKKVIGNCSIFDFKVVTATSAFTLNNCYVKGLVTESNYTGVKKGCTFETPLPKSGTTANRPTNKAEEGFQYLDTTLNKPIYLKIENTGTQEEPVYVRSWVDATGTLV